ncbi:[protein-PII] uridylyltransferase [Thiosocius teredinicola]|uniref:[protein-PII] uridylyltransferase n=1 Tax=Thiosocius teredinicola TaxID=1973002 RepID=UPI000990B7C7
MTDELLATMDRRLSAGEDPLPVFKQTLRSGREELADRFRAGTRASILVHTAAQFTDVIVGKAWSQFVPDDVDACLAAVGGYGRGELHPASDIDLLVLTAAEPTALAEYLEPLVMFLWDIGLEVGHSVRSLEQCVHEAASDITVITNLLECRLIAGSAKLFHRLLELTGPDRIWSSRDFFTAKAAEQRERYAKFDDSAHNLEPNLKEGPGGLRDIQTIGWVAKRHFGVSTMEALVEHGFLTDHEFRKLKRGEEHLWRVRYGLHLLTGRHEDRLLFEHQRALAKQFGYTDENANLAVEQFMQDYYRRIVEMQRLNEMLLQLFEEAILLNNQLGDPVPINRRFQARNGYLEVVNSGTFARYPLAMLELFLILQQNPQLQGVRASTIRLIRAHRHLIDDRFRKDLRARSLFIEIFREHNGLTHATRRMHRYGILARYLPAFHAVTGLMQFDLFHVYTVDEHILMVIRNMRRFSLDRHADECPRCNDVFKLLPKPELLYLAGLFHDIAKGRGGDHSKLGAEDAREFCYQHMLSEWDADLVAWLVEMHLVMSHTAQQEDIDDPDVVLEFAEKVRTRTRLDYLYLLTVADMRGTNPGRWNSWKAALLDHLHTRTREALERGLDQPQQQDDVIAQRQNDARSRLVGKGFDSDQLNLLWMSLSTDYFLQNNVDAIVWHTELLWPPGKTFGEMHVELREDPVHRCTDICIYGPDRDDLFAQSTALLDQAGLNVLSARIQTTESGLSLNTYLVLEEDGDQITGQERLDDIRNFVQQSLNSGEPPLSRPRIPRQLKTFQMPSQVSFEQDDSRVVTWINLVTSDRPGLLSLVGQAFAKNKLRLHNARVSTAGAEAQDTFAVTDRENQPITDPDQLACIAESIRAILDQPQ